MLAVAPKQATSWPKALSGSTSQADLATRPWRNVEHAEPATLLGVEWFNLRRLHGDLGDLTPAKLKTCTTVNHDR